MHLGIELLTRWHSAIREIYSPLAPEDFPDFPFLKRMCISSSSPTRRGVMLLCLLTCIFADFCNIYIPSVGHYPQKEGPCHGMPHLVWITAEEQGAALQPLFQQSCIGQTHGLSKRAPRPSISWPLMPIRVRFHWMNPNTFFILVQQLPNLWSHPCHCTSYGANFM